MIIGSTGRTKKRIPMSQFSFKVNSSHSSYLTASKKYFANLFYDVRTWVFDGKGSCSGASDIFWIMRFSRVLLFRTYYWRCCCCFSYYCGFFIVVIVLVIDIVDIISKIFLQLNLKQLSEVAVRHRDLSVVIELLVDVKGLVKPIQHCIQHVGWNIG